MSGLEPAWQTGRQPGLGLWEGPWWPGRCGRRRARQGLLLSQSSCCSQSEGFRPSAQLCGSSWGPPRAWVGVVPLHEVWSLGAVARVLVGSSLAPLRTLASQSRRVPPDQQCRVEVVCGTG